MGEFYSHTTLENLLVNNIPSSIQEHDGRGSYISASSGVLKFYVVLIRFTKYHWVDEIKEYEMGGTCSTHGSHVKCTQYFRWKT
jgi:hypothetical protein